MKLPTGWIMTKLKDLILSLNSGVSVNGEDVPASSNEKGVLKISAVTYGSFRPEENKRIIPSDFNRAYLNPKKDRIIMSRANTPDFVGASAYVSKDYQNLFLPDKLWQFEPNTREEFSMKWLGFVLASNTYRKMISDLASGSSKSMQNITKEDVLNLPIFLPPLPEQMAIASLLSTWDAAIEKTEQLIAAKEKLLDAYGRILFDRSIEGKKKGWAVVKLNEVLTEHGDKSTGSEEVFSVSVHKGLVNQIEHLGRSFSAADTSRYNRVHYGDIVYTKSPTGEFPLGIVKQSSVPQDVIVSPLYGVFRPNSYELGVILDFYFSSPIRAKDYLNPIIQKGAKNTIAITNQTFLSGKVNLPVEPAAQKKLANAVMAVRAEVTVLEKILDKYKLQKRGLMQKLLTGQWRVKSEIIKNYGDSAL